MPPRPGRGWTWSCGAASGCCCSAPNGAGKTTLLRCLAGLLAPARGEVTVCGGPPCPERLRGRVGYLFQNPRRQLFETTVFDEVAFTLRRLGTPKAEVGDRVDAGP